MIRKQELYNVECDNCKTMLDDENWWQEEESLEYIMDECDWKTLGGRHYCQNCWTRDDDDNIVTADGRKWNEDGTEIKN